MYYKDGWKDGHARLYVLFGRALQSYKIVVYTTISVPVCFFGDVIVATCSLEENCDRGFIV